MAGPRLPRLSEDEARRRAGELRNRLAGADIGDDPEALLEFVTREFGDLIPPLQVESEITAFLHMLRAQRPKAILEIGTAYGGCLFLFSQLAAPGAVLISVDLPDGELSYPEWKADLYRSFTRNGLALHLLRADSHDAGTLERVRRVLGSRELDLLFIDGDHTYEGVRQDFEMYAPLVGNGGWVAFHDIVPIDPPAAWCEVSRFWADCKARYPGWVELVDDPRQGWGGIGLIPGGSLRPNLRSSALIGG